MKEVHELEIYAPIDGFPNYLVTSHGRVFSLNYHRENKMKELKQSKDKGGYLVLYICKDGKRYFKNVHRLVAQAFIPNPENKPQVNHIDENKANNHVSNLEWATAKENSNHGTRTQRVVKYHKGRKRSKETKQKISKSREKYKEANHPRAKSIIGFKINGCDIRYYKYIKETKKDKFNPCCISDCCNGRQKSHKGYKWYYADDFFNRKESNDR